MSAEASWNFESAEKAKTARNGEKRAIYIEEDISTSQADGHDVARSIVVGMKDLDSLILQLQQLKEEWNASL